jgi:hypothetical protein
VLQSFTSFEDAIDYSLHAGIFTSRLDRALNAARCWKPAES